MMSTRLTAAGAVVQDLRNGISTGISRGKRVWIPTSILFFVLALAIGFGGGIFHPQVLNFREWWFLIPSLAIFPSLLEEFFFRGILIRRELLEQGWGRALREVFCSSIVFTLWHPINALTINPTAQGFFLNPVFLVITFLLGIAAGVGYIVSRSLWVPVLIHWATVIAWVFCLGGRNLVMEA